jgi:hypothetical protein
MSDTFVSPYQSLNEQATRRVSGQGFLWSYERNSVVPGLLGGVSLGA